MGESAGTAVGLLNRLTHSPIHRLTDSPTHRFPIDRRRYLYKGHMDIGRILGLPHEDVASGDEMLVEIIQKAFLLVLVHVVQNITTEDDIDGFSKKEIPFSGISLSKLHDFSELRSDSHDLPDPVLAS